MISPQDKAVGVLCAALAARGRAVGEALSKAHGKAHSMDLKLAQTPTQTQMRVTRADHGRCQEFQQQAILISQLYILMSGRELQNPFLACGMSTEHRKR